MGSICKGIEIALKVVPRAVEPVARSSAYQRRVRSTVGTCISGSCNPCARGCDEVRYSVDAATRRDTTSQESNARRFDTD